MKKDLSDPKYWDAFARGLVYSREDKPTPSEAAETVLRLMADLTAGKEALARAEKDASVARQQFKVFAMDVSNLANKYT